MKVLPKFDLILFLIAFSHYDWPIAQFFLNNKKLNWNFGTSPKMKFLCENVVAPLWFSYICEKGRTLGKPYDIKVWCYWNHPWEHIANLIIWNVMGTWKNKKFYAHSPHSNPRKKDEPSQVAIQPSTFLA
jgi:hypothetical protein